MMRFDVIHTLAHFLEAIPEQVALFDHHVVDHLVKNPDSLARFKNGCLQTKWKIYSELKYVPAKTRGLHLFSFA